MTLLDLCLLVNQLKLAGKLIDTDLTLLGLSSVRDTLIDIHLSSGIHTDGHILNSPQAGCLGNIDTYGHIQNSHQASHVRHAHLKTLDRSNSPQKENNLCSKNSQYDALNHQNECKRV